MNFTLDDLRPTIVPKSDQLNAEQLLGGPMTITVTEVRIGSSDEQPIAIHYANDNGRPYKPSKTQRKVLLFAWGQDGRAWIGRSMTIYCDPKIKFGGEEVGGIRISHISDIERDLQVSLTATKGKKALHVIKRLAVATVDHAAAMREAGTVDELKAAFKAAYRSSSNAKVQAGFKAEYDKRMAELTTSTKTLAHFKAQIDNATSAETATLVIDEARDVLTPGEIDELGQAFKMAWEA